MRFKNIFSLMLLLTMVFSVLPAFGQTSGFTVPSSHPRLYWNTARLNLAKSWYATHSFTPRSDDPMANALRYVLTGETSYARTAINWLVAWRLPAGQVLPTAIGCDECRWSGEEAMVVYDWCYDQMTPAERTTVVGLYNTYWSNVNQQDWGGIGMEGNNYYWGNIRNSLEWGIASFGENTQAQSFLDHALITRWQNSFVPYASTGNGKGGALGEGPQYGCTMLAYPIIPFITTELLGRQIFRESNFFQEALACLIYSTTPSPLINGTARYYDFFPYNEVEVEDMLHTRNYFGDFFTTFANHWESIPLGQYARRWVNLTNPATSRFVQCVNQTGRERSFGGLPFDYYAPGLGNLYIRTSWDTSATACMIQMRNADNVGHSHRDWSGFQLFRKGRYLTRETSGYAQSLTGVNGGNVDTEAPDAHNSLFVGVAGNMKSLIGGWQTAPATVKRLESREHYTYAAVDLSTCYQSAEKPELGNNYVTKVVREYLFVRPLEALVVFDRILASSRTIPAANVVKMALVHSETNPTLQDVNHALITNGNQALHLSTLLPANPSYQVVQEGGQVGQYRLQMTTSGAAQSYFLNVFQVRDATGSNLTTTITDEGSSYRLTLVHALLGNAVLVIQKGDTSAGGSFGFAATETPSPSPLLSRVQGISVNDSGPLWENLNVKSEEQSRRATEPLSLNVHPNPFAPVTNLSYVLKEPASVDLSLVAANGQFVAQLVLAREVAGSHEVRLGWQDLAKGVYFARLRINGQTTIVRKLILR
jgi:hypothetical protein